MEAVVRERRWELYFGHADFEVPLESANADVSDSIECMLWAEAKLQQSKG